MSVGSFSDSIAVKLSSGASGVDEDAIVALVMLRLIYSGAVGRWRGIVSARLQIILRNAD